MFILSHPLEIRVFLLQYTSAVSLIFWKKEQQVVSAVKGERCLSDVPKKPREARKRMPYPKWVTVWLDILVKSPMLKKDPFTFSKKNIFAHFFKYTLYLQHFCVWRSLEPGCWLWLGWSTRARNQAWRWKVEPSDTFFEGRRFDQWIFSAGKTIGKKAFVITFLLSVLLIYQVYIYMYMWP